MDVFDLATLVSTNTDQGFLSLSICFIKLNKKGTEQPLVMSFFYQELANKLLVVWSTGVGQIGNTCLSDMTEH